MSTHYLDDWTWKNSLLLNSIKVTIVAFWFFLGLIIVSGTIYIISLLKGIK